MKKEIIIDDVNVAGCFAFNNMMCEYELLKHRCEGDNCYYKQLQQFKKLYDELINRVSLENYERLEQENKELKETLARLNEERINHFNYKEEKYRQALEEIRANVQNWINSPWSCFNCRNNMDERLTEIKNKINEVLK